MFHVHRLCIGTHEFQPGPVKSRFVSPRNCTVDEIREVLGKYKRESAAKAGQHPGFDLVSAASLTLI